MFLRVFSFLILMIFVTSCDKFSFKKNTNSTNKIVLDTIVDFSSVDTFPSFKVCDSLIDKQKKSDCFRTTIHQKIGEELLQHQLIIKDSIDEIIYVDLIINSSGIFMLDAIESSENIKNQLPELDSLIKSSILKIPKIFPATKRGQQVITEFDLPIIISVN